MLPAVHDLRVFWAGPSGLNTLQHCVATEAKLRAQVTMEVV